MITIPEALASSIYQFEITPTGVQLYGMTEPQKTAVTRWNKLAGILQRCGDKMTGRQLANMWGEMHRLEGVV